MSLDGAHGSQSSTGTRLSTPATSIDAIISEPSLSPLAERFVPSWLKRANNILLCEHEHFPDLSVPRPQLDSHGDALYTPVLIEHFAQEEHQISSRATQTTQEIITALAEKSQTSDMPSSRKADNFARHWHTAIAHEHAGIADLLDRARLFSRKLIRSAQKHLEGLYFAFEAPHIRENWPPIDYGDSVLLVSLNTRLKMARSVFEAHVHRLGRSTGQIIVRCDSLRGLPTSAMSFNIIFSPQERYFINCHRAVELLQQRINAKLSNLASTLPKAWLFPEWIDMIDAVMPAPHPGSQGQPGSEHNDNLKWVDQGLNAEQMEAVSRLVRGKRRVPMLISGPPGTGKTKTIVEAVLQILRADAAAHVLVCGASGPSADTVTARLVPHLRPTEMLRLNDVSRGFEEVSSNLMPFCEVVDGSFAVPSVSTLLSKRVIICSVDEAALLIQARCTNWHVGQLVEQVIGPFASTKLGAPPYQAGLKALNGPHFTHCLIDEAAQAHQPQTFIPLAVMTPAKNCSPDAPPQICLCGDTRQLGPSIVSEDARNLDMDCSLLEDLLRRAVYRGHPDTRENKLARRRGHHIDAWEEGGNRDKPFVELVRNYRSVPHLIMLPSALYYADSLIACAPRQTTSSSLRKWSRLPRQDFPLLFVGTSTNDIMVDEGVSWCNQGDVNLICELVSSFMEGATRNDYGPIKSNEISVITPFREQVWRIRLALRAAGLSAVDVGNVESLQGKENRVVFISTVRASINRIQEDQKNNRGLIFQPRRLNVALTRAMELLVIVGDPSALCVDPDWCAYLAFCHRNKVYQGVKLPDRVTDALESNVSYMEEALIGNDLDDGGQYLRSRILAGAVVNAVLRE